MILERPLWPRIPVPNRTRKTLSAPAPASGPRSMGLGINLLVAESNCATASISCELSGFTRTAIAAGAPAPSAFAVKIEGETVLICVAPVDVAPLLPVTVSVAGPGIEPAGVRKLICIGETKKSGAARSVPVLSLTLTVVPPSVVGRGRLSAAAVMPVNPAPKTVIIASAELLPDWKLAAETIAVPAGAPIKFGAVTRNTFGTPVEIGGLDLTLNATPSGPKRIRLRGAPFTLGISTEPMERNVC